MKYIAKTLIIATALSAANGANAYLIDGFCPVIGVDYYQAWMNAKHNYSRILPHNSYPGASIYVGAKFQECFGVEVGWDWSKRKSRDFTLTNGSSFFGNTVSGTTTGKARVSRRGGHIDLVGYLPVFDCFDFFGSVGWGWVESKIHVSGIAVNGVQRTSTQQSSALASLHGKGRSVLRLGIGANYMFTECLGVRAKFGWETTGSQRVHGNMAARSLGYSSKPFRDSGTLAVGAFVKF